MILSVKDKGLDAEISDSDDSDTSSDDNDGENPEFDEEFFKALGSIKSKDPKIYEKDTKFFQSASKKEAKATSKKNKPFTVKDLERKVILENDGEFVDDDDEATQRPASPSLAEKERAIKRQLASVVNADSDDEEDGEGWGGLFVKRNKSSEEEVREEKQYAQWLAGQEKNIKEEDKEVLSGLKSYWNNPKLSKEDKFLRDYILKGKHKEGGSSKGIPTRDEILGEVPEEDAAPLSEDERDLEQQEEFEKKYNFRFEEPDQDFIKSYPRTIEWSVRAEDERRKQKRAELKERKAREKEQQRQELEMLKEIKRKEIQDKINKLKMVTGAEQIPINDDFLNEDFDPEEHDRKMQEMFNDEYYQVDEGEEKPEYPEDIDDLKVEDYDNYDPMEEDELGGEEGEAEDAEAEQGDPSAARKKQFQEEVLESSRGRRRKRQSKFLQMLRKDKPVFDPEDEKTYGEYIDEYYKLDYEDMIGDVKCRFKYVETVPNDFGLTTAEILLAKSKELNQWAGIKKAVQIRPPHVEMNEAKVYQAKGRNINLKKKILKSLFPGGVSIQLMIYQDPSINFIPSLAALKATRRRRRKKIRNQPIRKKPRRRRRRNPVPRTKNPRRRCPIPLQQKVNHRRSGTGTGKRKQIQQLWPRIRV